MGGQHGRFQVRFLTDRRMLAAKVKRETEEKKERVSQREKRRKEKRKRKTERKKEEGEGEGAVVLPKWVDNTAAFGSAF